MMPQNLPFVMPKDKPRGQSNGSILVLTDQIKALYDAKSDLEKRNKALVLLTKDCSLRIGDICALDVGDFAEASLEYDERNGDTFRVFKPLQT